MASQFARPFRSAAIAHPAKIALETVVKAVGCGGGHCGDWRECANHELHFSIKTTQTV
jgi:hypothetical protein